MSDSKEVFFFPLRCVKVSVALPDWDDKMVSLKMLLYNFGNTAFPVGECQSALFSQLFAVLFNPF